MKARPTIANYDLNVVMGTKIKKIQSFSLILALTESGKELDSSDDVGGQVLIDCDVGRIEDGDRVEDDGVDAAPLLEDHDCEAQHKRVPHLLHPQGSEERRLRATYEEHTSFLINWIDGAPVANLINILRS